MRKRRNPLGEIENKMNALIKEDDWGRTLVRNWRYVEMLSTDAKRRISATIKPEPTKKTKTITKSTK